MAYKFSLDFQKHILASAICDASFLKECSDVIKPEYFGDEILGGIAECTLTFYAKEKECPSKAALQKELKAQVAPGRKLHEYVEVLDEVLLLGGKNARYYQEQAVQFAKSQAMANALREAPLYLESGEFDALARSMQIASQTGSGLDGQNIYDYFAQAGERIKGYLNGHDSGERIATGIPLLDDCMAGGLGKGELGTVVALPGHGKTTTLVNFAARALLQDKKVMYVTMELSKTMIAKKLDTCIFGRTYEAIKNEPKQFAIALAEMRDRLSGKLFIVEYPTKRLSVDRLGAIASKIGADLVLVDYAQLIKAPAKREQRRHEITETYEALRGLAGELQVPLWTAHQSNRPGAGAKVILQEHIAEDFNVVAISDICVSVNHDEEEMRNGLMRMFIMKSRIGPSGQQINMTANWKLGRILEAK